MTSLADLLSRETELVSQFVTLLEQEQEVLQSGTPDSLETVSKKKDTLVGQLNQLETERGRLVAPSANADDRSGMKAWLAQHPHDKHIPPLWEKLNTLARQAKALHEINGQLIEIHLSRTSAALAILEQHKQQHSLYGSDGQASAPTGSRIVDSA